MKIILFISLLSLSPGILCADTFHFTDGSIIKGEASGEINGKIVLKTKYGSLFVDKADIIMIDKENQATEQEPVYTLKTVRNGAAKKEIFYKDSVAIATKTAEGGSVYIEGKIEDALYREYYGNGGVKAEITIRNGKRNGISKTYFENGKLQSEAEYSGDKINGKLTIYGENGKKLFEQEFSGSVPNGYFRQFDENGRIIREDYYRNGILSSPGGKTEMNETQEEKVHSSPKKNETSPEPAKTADFTSGLTGKLTRLARGERYLFYENGKYSAKIMVDRNFNIINKSGKFPDGTVNVYSGNGEIARAITFISGQPVYIKIYENGKEKEEYSYLKDLAVKKK